MIFTSSFCLKRIQMGFVRGLFSQLAAFFLDLLIRQPAMGDAPKETSSGRLFVKSKKKTKSNKTSRYTNEKHRNGQSHSPPFSGKKSFPNVWGSCCLSPFFGGLEPTGQGSHKEKARGDRWDGGSATQGGPNKRGFAFWVPY